MRISDWRSDVCSSDLQVLASLAETGRLIGVSASVAGTRPRLLKVRRGFSFALGAGIAAALLGAGPVHGGPPDLSPLEALCFRQPVEVHAATSGERRAGREEVRRWWSRWSAYLTKKTIHKNTI